VTSGAALYILNMDQCCNLPTYYLFQLYLTFNTALDTKIKEDDKATEKKSEDEIEIEKAYFLVSQALEADEAGQHSEAKNLYTKAVGVCLEAVRVRVAYYFTE